MTPADHANTIRDVLTGRRGGEAEFGDALAALDALQAQAETDEADAAALTVLLKDAEDERDQLKTVLRKATEEGVQAGVSYSAQQMLVLKAEVEAAEAERDRLIDTHIVEEARLQQEIGHLEAERDRKQETIIALEAQLVATGDERDRLRDAPNRVLAIIGIYDTGQNDPAGMTAEETIEAIRAALAGEDT